MAVHELVKGVNIALETFEMRLSRDAVAADNQRHVKYVPEGE